MSSSETSPKFYDDEPSIDSKLFDSESYSTKIKDIIVDPKLNTPFVICIDGKWGEGKTSLLGAVYNKVESHYLASIEDAVKEKYKVIWFNAWEYERIDPVAALLFKVQEQFKGRRNKFKKAAKGLGLVLFDMAIRAHTNLSLPEVQKYFEDSIKNISTIKDDLENMIENGKLIIFVDDLDRCIIEKTLEMLEALKLLFNAKNVIVIIAADIEKLEKAWTLRYNNLSPAIEGRDHIDKIFQIKISLPNKNEEKIKNFMKSLGTNYSQSEEALISIGCNNNPRKIKKILNMLNFSNKFYDPKNSKEKVIIIFWYILITVYPNLLRLMRDPIPSLVRVLIILYQFDSFEMAKNKLNHMQYHETGNKNHSIPLSNEFSIPAEQIYHQIRDTSRPNEIVIGSIELDLLNFIIKDPHLYEFLHKGAELLGNVKYKQDEKLKVIFDNYGKEQTDTIKSLISNLVILS